MSDVMNTTLGEYQELVEELQATIAEKAVEIERLSVSREAYSAKAVTRLHENEELKATITSLTDTLEEAITGIEWYRTEHPESDSGADDEFMERARAALQEKT